MTRRLKILVKLDNVAVDFLTPVLAKYNAEHGDALMPQALTSYSLKAHVKESCGENVYDYLDAATIEAAHPILGAVDALRTLANAHDVYLVSVPKLGCGDAKYDWCRRHLPFIPRENVGLFRPRHLIRADVVVDDDPAALEAYRDTWGVAPFICAIAWPWNEGVGSFVDLRAEGWRHPEIAWQRIVKAIEERAGAPEETKQQLVLAAQAPVQTVVDAPGELVPRAPDDVEFHHSPSVDIYGADVSRFLDKMHENRALLDLEHEIADLRLLSRRMALDPYYVQRPAMLLREKVKAANQIMKLATQVEETLKERGEFVPRSYLQLLSRETERVFRDMLDDLADVASALGVAVFDDLFAVFGRMPDGAPWDPSSVRTRVQEWCDAKRHEHSSTLARWAAAQRGDMQTRLKRIVLGAMGAAGPTDPDE